ncbi:cation-translocating P-type ATPase [Anaerotruncus massiliensis (ex Togo et al. 2019)]|nr:cation-translocating P-type ATPase [Anaerotruncus massiliensis (ex Togo et al. 2019)]GKH47612.1 calcium-transporting P-type ATPase, PMR1-type [Oscillospiraceae bacterium]
MEDYQGLTGRQAEKLLAEHGENRIRAGKKAGMLKIFAGQFRDAMIMILLAATVVSALMGEYTEALTIVAIVFINALLGFFQEYRTERTLEKLGELSAPWAVVVRDGQARSIPASEVVPQDIFCLKAGDRVPADGCILGGGGILCDESMLSGESAGVEKSPAADPAAAAKKNLVYMGTLVTQGKAICRASATGADTEMGKIADMLGGIEAQPTPLQKRLAQMGKVIGVACLVICGVVAVTGILRGEDPFNMLLTGISLAVAAIPEGLPAVVTIALALSVGRMVKRGALIRRLHAVETLGCANVICSDKTGTLTENRMTVKAVQTLDCRLEVSGAGNESTGQFTLNGRVVEPCDFPSAAMLLDVALLCNNASVTPKREGLRGLVGLSRGGELEVFGEPTEAALLVMAAKAGLYRESRPYEVEGEIPFDSTRKMMSVIVRREDGRRFLFTKGAPDILQKRCTRCATKSGIVPLTPELRRQIAAQNEAMAGRALRVLGFAYREASSPDDRGEQGLIFAGLAGMLDPPRKEAYGAVAKCREAGIRPVMITGDHAVTAKAVAAELSIYQPGDRVVTGSELDGMSDEALAREIKRISVFARVTPAHKLRIVRALKKQGNVVAMTGDGVNDAPAVKEADIGVSMGVTGTDVTKEASSVILMDDNFATLVSAVEEGRVIYRNIRKFIRYLFSCNIGEVVTMFFAMLMGMPVPLLPIQILLVNLATDGLPAIALGLEPPDKDVMREKPRRADESVFSNGLGFTIVIRGLLIGICTLGVFTSLIRSCGDLHTARTGALLALVMMQLIHVFECKSETKSIFAINPFNNLKLVGAVLSSAVIMYFAIYNPLLAPMFRAVPLTLSQLVTVASYCVFVPIVSGVILGVKNRTVRHTVATASELASAR